MISNKVLDEAARRFVEEFHPEKIILFGSQTRGTADSHIDVDILVISVIKEKRRKLMVDMRRVLDELDYDKKRRILITLNMNKVVHHIWEAIRFENTESIMPVFNSDSPIRSVVEAWVKNDHLGFEILYIFKGEGRKYRPDFIIRLKNGKNLILETKGQNRQQDKTKREFLDERVKAVNQHGSFGIWLWSVSKDPADVAEILEKAGEA